MSAPAASPFKTRKLGRADVRVGELGLGTAPLGDLFDRVEDDEAAAMFRAAWDGGIRYFDTSPWYGRGQAEHASAARSTASLARTSSYPPRFAACCGAR